MVTNLQACIQLQEARQFGFLAGSNQQVPWDNAAGGPPEITNERLTMQVEKNSLQLPPSSVKGVSVAGRKCGVWSMGDLPHSKLSKRLKGVV